MIRGPWQRSFGAARVVPSRSLFAGVRAVSATVTSTGLAHQLLRGRSARSVVCFSTAAIALSAPAAAAAPSSAAAAVSDDPLALVNPMNAGVLSQLKALKPESWKVKLYQYQTCPFCNKVRAFLDFYRIPYEVVEVNPASKAELKAVTKYSRVPFVTVSGAPIDAAAGSGAATVPVVDSTDIMSALYQSMSESQRRAPHHSAAPLTADTKRWRSWTDDHLLHLFPPNIYSTMSESFASFDYMVESSSMSWSQRFVARTLGGVAMYFVAKNNIKKYKIKEPRSDLCAAIDTWMNEGVTAARAFHGGSEPDLADVTVFGALRSLAGFRVGAELREKMKDTRFTQWYEAMAKRTGPSLRANPLAKPTAFCETAPAASAAAAKP